MKNKKGQSLSIILIIGGVLLGVLALSFLMMMGYSAVKEATDIILPDLNNLGNDAVGINVSEGTQLVTPPIEGVIGNFSLIMVFLYVVGLISVFAIAFMFRGEVNAWNMAFFFMLTIGIVLICILISNSYEDLYNTNDNVGLTLRSAGIISFLIINSPAIFTFISFIAGIILFSGSPQESVI